MATVILQIIGAFVLGSIFYAIFKGLKEVFEIIYDFFYFLFDDIKENIRKVKKFIRSKSKRNLSSEKKQEKLEDIAYWEQKISELKNAISEVERDISKLKSDFPEVFKYGNPYEYFDRGFDSPNEYKDLLDRKNRLEKELQKYLTNLCALKSYWESNDWNNTINRYVYKFLL